MDEFSSFHPTALASETSPRIMLGRLHAFAAAVSTAALNAAGHLCRTAGARA